MPYEIRDLTPTYLHAGQARTSCVSAEISAALAILLPGAGQHAMANGAQPVGPPTTRYLEWPDNDSHTFLEAGLPIAAPVAPGDGFYTTQLPGGRAAVTTHLGNYTGLMDAYLGLETWLKANGHQAAGAPWEQYMNDPATTPEAEWKTVIFQPIK